MPVREQPHRRRQYRVQRDDQLLLWKLQLRMFCSDWTWRARQKNLTSHQLESKSGVKLRFRDDALGMSTRNAEK